MSNIREQLLAKTAGLASPAEMTPVRKDADKGTRSPQTMPGLTSALTAAQIRIQELEDKGVGTDLRVNEISPNPWQPRREFNESKLHELARSIEETGLLQSVLVRRVGDDAYQLVAGERRWRAHKLLNRETIKSVVIDCTDQDMAALALVENVTRDDLSDYEIALSVRRAESEFPNKTRLAKTMGISRNELYRYLAFDELPDFVKRDLDLRPTLLQSNQAQEIVSALKKTGDAGVKALTELWPQVVAGDLLESKVAPAILAAATRGVSTRDVAGRSILKIFSGNVQAGSITKDVAGLTFKFKAGVISEEQERALRETVAKMFSVQPE
ncbi:ParB/RepB/Spo0J family partition protein [Paraburkholderia tagetis]|uniref:ParB/RepB/Spo0J family partition protein n=1 Tax=Paraburkholderia tagetis TaxID=2913261 RepID=A0A9X1RTV4_9BURK|nr:ParB/RepB/Spo0J family partition protein [Paraburkholderia tagetis]MCG5076334.1 ParB/RepB/Spo0J family partition protein [Paraburkholderia tagetis]